MANKQKTRSEIADADKWDLSNYYQTDAEFESDFNKLDDLLQKIESFKGQIAKNAKSLLTFLRAERDLSIVAERLIIYVTLKADEDFENDFNSKRLVLVKNKGNIINERLSFTTPELLKTDYAIIQGFIKEEEGLQEFAFVLEKIYRYAPYVLPADKEEMLINFSSITRGFKKSFDLIKNVQLKYGNFKDENDQVVELTNSNYRLYLKNSKRRVRRKVNRLYLSQYEQNNMCIAENIMGCFKTENYIAKVRGFKSALDQSLFNNKIDEKVYHNLLTTVENNLPILGQYYDLVKKELKLPNLFDYDVTTPLVLNSNVNYSYQQAQEIIIEALGILGEDYVAIIKKAFVDKWIDIYPNKGKVAGFYCMPSCVTTPSILANYEGKFEDVSSLTHELGHAVNCYYSSQKNPYQYRDHSIFVAEVASLTNELILSNYLLNKTTDKNEKKIIINYLISLYQGNLFSASKGAHFELDLHKKLQNNEVVTNTTINELWEDLTKLYYNDKVGLTKYSKYGWSIIPHFYNNYYYYQYATGISIATYVADKIINGDQIMFKNYKEFLKTGSDDYPLNHINKLGVDMHSPVVIEKAIKAFEKLIDQYKKIDNS